MTQHRHEPYGRNVRPTLIAAAALVIMVALVLAVVALQYRWLTRRAERLDPEPSPLASHREPGPGPQLQVHPKEDLRQLHAREDAVLNSYGWVDRPQGVVHIPIDRAMELMAQ